jgi:F-type H+-transporting ATPase subunit a
MFISMILLVFIFVATAKTYSRSRKGEPTGLGKFTEPLILFIKDEVAVPMIGEKNYKKYMPFLLTLFFFIWINNVMGLIPFFPFSANLSGNIAFTFVLAAITFIITTLVANKDYWKHIFWMPGIPVPRNFHQTHFPYDKIICKYFSRAYYSIKLDIINIYI